MLLFPIGCPIVSCSAGQQTLARCSILTSALAATAVCAKPRLEARARVQVKDMPLSKSVQMARVRNRHTAPELQILQGAGPCSVT